MMTGPTTAPETCNSSAQNPRHGRLIPLLLLLLLGVVPVYMFRDHLRMWPPRWIALAVAALLCLIPATNQHIAALLQRLRHPTTRTRWLAAVALALFSFAFLHAAATSQSRYIQRPEMHDENVYLIQAQMAAHGRLWMPQHPLSEFFRSFYLFDTPVYAGCYLPGNALFLAPAVWLHLPIWVMPLAAASASVGMIYIVMAELIDGVAGLLAALLLVASSGFRVISVIVMPQAPMLLFLLLMLWAAMRWRRQRDWRWCLLIGFFGMWAFMCHPSEAVCYFPPLGVAMLWGMRHDGIKRISATLGVLTLAAAPLIAIQIISNVGIAGHWYELPYALYIDKYYPSYHLGFPTYHPTSQPLPQMKDLDRLFAGDIRRQTVANIIPSWLHYKLPEMGRSMLANVLLLLFIPLGFLSLRDPFRAVIVSALGLFMILFTFYAFMFRWYPVPLLPALFVLLLGGLQVLARLGGERRFFATFPVLMLAVLAVCALPGVDPRVDDNGLPAQELRQIDYVLANKVQPPAVVLFRYRTSHLVGPAEEPVYNYDVAWPDNAPIIKAQDLGAENIKLFDYYAQRQPKRRFYLYDRSTQRLTQIGPTHPTSRSRN
jgi:4-amino-4-deoxy-L-arabinose transferase-like glycosyltransferase